MEQFTVIIRKDHCEGADYFSHTDCPLARAIKEQNPTFDLKDVGGYEVEDMKGNMWKIQGDDLETSLPGWNNVTMKKIISGEKENCHIILTKM